MKLNPSRKKPLGKITRTSVVSYLKWTPKDNSSRQYRECVFGQLVTVLLVVLLLATTAQRLSTAAAADVPVITRICILVTSSPIGPRTIWHFFTFLFGNKKRFQPHSRFGRVQLQISRRKCLIKSCCFTRKVRGKVPMLTECIRWPRPSQSQSGEVLLSHMHRSISSMQE